MKRGIERKYLPEFVYGGTDGAITTFTIVSGAFGASLSSSVILIFGFANLFADGFSMAISNYLSTKSRKELKNKSSKQINPKKTALATFISFFIIGLIPLLSFVLAIFTPISEQNKFIFSTILTGFAFLFIGGFKGLIVKKPIMKSAILTLFIGGIAAILAFIVGYLLKGLLT